MSTTVTIKVRIKDGQLVMVRKKVIWDKGSHTRIMWKKKEDWHLCLIWAERSYSSVRWADARHPARDDLAWMVVAHDNKVSLRKFGDIVTGTTKVYHTEADV